MSSMLLKPTARLCLWCTAPKRLDTFWMGVPKVFHTAPPQPASKARITWPPELAGGAEASQNGFGERMPATLQDRSATGASTEVAIDGEGGALALGGGVDHLL